MLALAFAALMLSQTPPGVAPSAPAPEPAVLDVSSSDAGPRAATRSRSSTPSRAISARAPTVANAQTRTVCGWERTMDSNIQQRVCRRVAVGSQRERMATDTLREMQGSRWGELPVPRSPGGRPVG